VAGNVEGVVSSLGLLYLTLASGEDRIMVPNSVALNAAVTPLREPDAVNLRARLPVGTRPSDLQVALADSLTVATRSAPDIELVEVDDDEVVVQIGATPQRSADGPQLADQILAAVGRLTTRGNGNGSSRADHGTDGTSDVAERSGDGRNDPARSGSPQQYPGD
jgi:small conductance mechanosensitive channel